MKKIEKPRKAPRQQRALAMVETILDAAARILASEGYATMSTNRVAEIAGVSVGSLYQYFPNKDALVAALHERHGRQMHEMLADALTRTEGRSLRETIAALVCAAMQGHMIEPELHRVLEAEFPFFDEQDAHKQDHMGLHAKLRVRLETHRAEITPRNLDLAHYMVSTTIQTMVHAAVIEPPRAFTITQLEAAIVDLVMGYLGAGVAKPAISATSRRRAFAPRATA